MADSKALTVGLSVVIVVLVVVAAAGFYEYSVVSSKYSSLRSSYARLNQSYASLSGQYSSLLSNYSRLNQSYSKLESQYSTLEGLYQAALSYARGNHTLYEEAEANYTSLLSEVSGLRPGAALSAVLGLYDGISIEAASDVLPFLAKNFTAVVEGQPFPGTYNLETFNTTWLSEFFSDYETVYFYTTALPAVTEVNPSTYNVTDVVQFFVAPTSDPVYLQVLNVSNVITVQFIGGRPEITRLLWKGSVLPPSAVIAGYPSQHSLQAGEALEVVLSQLNSLAAELPASTIAQGFSPSGQLVVEGQLPPALKAGAYVGLESIEGMFNAWDSYFIFALVYAQNLLPNGTAVPPTVEVDLTTGGASAVVTANDTVFLGFVNEGEPGFPAIYDLHVDLTAYLAYNSTSASWQITKEVWNVTQATTLSDTVYYDLNEPIMKVNGEETVTVNATSGRGYALQVGNILVIVRPHTYAEFPNGTLVPVYNFSLVTFSLESVYPPAPDYGNLTPLYAFAFAVDGKITPAISLVTEVDGKVEPQAPITVVWAPDTWTSWTWFGGTFNGTAYIGGGYKFADKWVYGDGVMVNLVFFKPVIWVFESAQAPVGQPPKPVEVPVKPAYGLTPVNAYSYEVNGTQGGVVVAGNIIAVIRPDTEIETPSGNLTTFNFSIVFYNPATPGAAPNGQVPVLVFAYAVDGNVTFSYSAINSKTGAPNPFVTVILAPSENVTMWTWGPKGYMFEDPIIVGRGVVINLTFFKPVPWILTAPQLSDSTSVSASP